MSVICATDVCFVLMTHAAPRARRTLLARGARALPRSLQGGRSVVCPCRVSRPVSRSVRSSELTEMCAALLIYRDHVAGQGLAQRVVRSLSF